MVACELCSRPWESRLLQIAENKSQLCICLALHVTWCLSVYRLTNLCGLDDSEVIHAGYAGAHGCSQTCCTKLHPGGEAFLQSLHRSFFHQVLHHWDGLGILEMKKNNNLPRQTGKARFSLIFMSLLSAAKWFYCPSKMKWK